MPRVCARPACAASARYRIRAAADYAPEEIAESVAKLRQAAGLPKEPTGLVADLKAQTKRSTKKATARSRS
jgi:hypothetical protein